MYGEKVETNDGGGLLDSSGMINSLIMDCNSLPKSLMDGNYVEFCKKIVEMVQKMGLLQDGIKSDIASKDEIIADLRRMNRELSEKVYGVPCDSNEEPAVSPDEI